MSNIPPPDWSRVTALESRAQGGPLVPVGDPTKWGGQITQVITPPAVGLSQRFDTGQFLRAQASDRYGRLWALTGTIRAPAALQILPLPDWDARLEVTQGVGQTIIVQEFNLRLLNTIAFAGGYAAPVADGGFVSWPFAMMGAIVGQQWGARMRYLTTTNVPAGNHEITVSVIAAVLAAGTNL